MNHVSWPLWIEMVVAVVALDFVLYLQHVLFHACLLYTSDAADERSRVDLWGRRIIKKKKHTHSARTTQSHITNTTLICTADQILNEI